jgi:diguanylate cyclase (GGDEF)-like protein
VPPLVLAGTPAPWRPRLPAAAARLRRLLRRLLRRWPAGLRFDPGRLDPRRVGWRRRLAAALLLRGVALVAMAAAGPIGAAATCVPAALCAAAGVLAMPRRYPPDAPNPELRFRLDAALTAVAAAVLTWWVWVGPGLGRPGSRAFPLAVGLLLVLLDLLTAAMGLMLLVRRITWQDLRGGPAAARLGGFVAGLFLQVAVDVLLLTRAGSQTGSQTGSQSLLAWTAGLAVASAALIAEGIARLPAEAGPPLRVASRARETAPSWVASMLTVVLFLPAVLLWPVPQPQSWALSLVVLSLGVFALRERFNTVLRTQLTARLRRQALLDPLTGLANRRALTRRIAAVADAEPWVVLTLDLDNFAQANDVLGYARADQLLVEVASVLREHNALQAVQAAGLVARTGGDEFAVLMPGDLAAGRASAEQLRLRIRDLLRHSGQAVTVSASLGVGPLETGQGAGGRDRLTGLVESAAALRAAKAGARNCVVVYEGEVAAAHRRHRMLDQRLRAGRADDLDVVLQPIVDLATGRVLGVEALARLSDPELAAIGPAEFIPIAEQAGAMIDLGAALLIAAVNRAAALDDRTGRDDFTLAVNLSFVQLRSPEFPALVRDVLAAHDIEPHRLLVEVPERGLRADDDAVVGSLVKLAELGVRIAIDHFGTGYLALSCLRWLPVHVLKVDPSLTRNPADPRDRPIVDAVIDLAHRSGLQVVMQGLEQPEVVRHWRAAGADAGQGRILAGPMAWTDAATVLSDGIRLP